MKRLSIPVVLIVCLMLLAPASGPTHAGGTGYTVEVGRFDDLIEAGDRFNVLYRELSYEDREHLRIEFAQGMFILRSGRFDTTRDARKRLGIIRQFAPGAQVAELGGSGAAKVLIEHAVITQVTIRGDEDGSRKAAVISATVASDEKAVETFLQDIAATFESGDYNMATALIQRGLKQWPDRHELYAWYGAAMLDTGDPDKAYEQYRKAAELRPNVPEYHAGAGFSLLNIYVDRAKRSVDSFEKALELDPNNIDALEGLGIVYVSIGKRRQAEEMLARLRQLDTQSAARLSEYIAWGLDWSR